MWLSWRLPAVRAPPPKSAPAAAPEPGSPAAQWHACEEGAIGGAVDAAVVIDDAEPRSKANGIAYKPLQRPRRTPGGSSGAGGGATERAAAAPSRTAAHAPAAAAAGAGDSTVAVREADTAVVPDALRAGASDGVLFEISVTRAGSGSGPSRGWGRRELQAFFTVRTEKTGEACAEVERRYCDFDDLHRLLRDRSRGLFLPPPPCKALIAAQLSRSQAPAAGKRRGRDGPEACLQAYVSAASCHPALRNTEELRLFLLFPGDLAHCRRWQQLLRRPAPRGARALLAGLAPFPRGGGGGAAGGGGSDGGFGGFESGREEGEPAPSPSRVLARGGGGAREPAAGPPAAGAAAAGAVVAAGAARGGRAIAGMAFASLRGRLLAGAPPAREGGAPLSEEEARLRDAKDMLRKLLSHLEVANTAAQSLVAHMESLCGDLEAANRGTAATARGGATSLVDTSPVGKPGAAPKQRDARAGVSSHRARRAAGAIARQISCSLASLHGWQVLIPEAILALEEREAALAVAQSLEECLSARPRRGRGAARGAAFSLDGVSTTELEDRVRAARARYELLRGRNEAELRRLNLGTADGFRAALRHFSRVQAQLAAAVVDAWGAAAARGADAV